jgi:hypothetical protein
MKISLGIALVFLGQIIGWFQLNSQYISEWWEDRPITAAFTLGVPCSIAFWYSWKLIIEETGSAWTARFIGSSAGLIIFPILTWFLLGETMFTPKTMVCFGLAVLIIFIQIYC